MDTIVFMIYGNRLSCQASLITITQAHYSARADGIAAIIFRLAARKPGQFIAPHGIAVDSRGDLYVAEVTYSVKGRHETPPREIRSLRKFARADR